MSELKVNKISPRSGTDVTLGDSGDTFSVPSGATLDASNATVTYPAGSITDAAISSTAAIQQSKISGSPGFRNIVINGDMSIAQRSTSVASITAAGYYTVDRMNLALSSLGTWTQSQSTDVPTGQGFATSLKMDCTTADAAPAAGGFLVIRQLFEGQNLQYLKKGTANAVSLTASFWVKSTKTGTFILELFDVDNTRQISAAYTVNVTDTWEKKTITFPGDTTGALDNDNASSFNLQFWLGAGSDRTSGTLNTTWGASVNANRVVGQVNIADDTANDWYITGVQLEAGTTASDFEFLPVDVNLARCQRYYYKQKAVAQYNTFGAGLCDSTILPQAMTVFPVTMRTAPTALEQSGTAGDYILRIANSNPVCTVVPQFTTACSFSATYFFEVASGLTAGQAMFARANNTNAFLAWSAEL
jgi:hypothetical protein